MTKLPSSAGAPTSSQASPTTSAVALESAVLEESLSSFQDRRSSERRRAEPTDLNEHRRRFHRRWLDRVSQVASGAEPDDSERPAPVVVTVRQGIAGSVFKAWEEVADQSDVGRYCVIGGKHHRQIGTGLLPLSDLQRPEGPQAAYQAEYARAYDAIYREYPELRGMGEEHGGEILMANLEFRRYLAGDTLGGDDAI